MKKFFGGSMLGMISILLAMQIGTVSCTKDKTIYDTVTLTKTDTLHKTDTVTKVDTLRIKDTIVTLQILTANPWKLYEIRGVTNNVPYYYLRGGSSNTSNYDNEYITFKQDKTGVYVDPNGGVSQLVWDFDPSDSTKITYTVYFPTVTTTINWEHLKYKNNMLNYDEYFSQNGLVYSHSHGIRMTK